MDSEEEAAMELVYGEEEDMEGLGQEEGQDQEVPQAPSPLEEEQASGEQEVALSYRMDLQEQQELQEQEQEGQDMQERQEQEQGQERGQDQDEEEVREQEQEQEVAVSRTPAEPRESEEEHEESPHVDSDMEEEVTVPEMLTSEEPSETVVAESDKEQESGPSKTVDEDLADQQKEETKDNEFEQQKQKEEEKDPEELQEPDQNESKDASIGSSFLKESKEEVVVKHPGVFEVSESPPEDEKEDKSKEILDSLPLLERLRGISRASSIRDDASMSGAHSEASETCSLAAAAAPAVRRLRSNKDGRKKETRVQSPLPTTRKVSASSGKGRNGGVGKVTRSTRGKGRRNLAKKKPVKAAAETMRPTVTTSTRIYFQGQYLEAGDIVSVTDLEDDDVYYAQLRGFLTDEYAEKSGVITWLLPTTESPPPWEGFHPATYVLGPEEDVARKLEVFTFVMHAPSDYFHNKRAPYRTVEPPGDGAFTLARLGPRLRRTVDDKAVYVGIY